MDVVLLGTGCPTSHPERRGAATLVRSANSSFVIDCGSGVTQRLVEAGVPGKDLDALVLTHLHTDHVIDLYQLIMSSWHQGRRVGWTIYGPAGTAQFIAATMDLWAAERDLRIAHERRPSSTGLEVDVREVANGEQFTIGDLRVVAVEVDHRPVQPALGFVIETKDKRCVISGDTRPTGALVDAGRAGGRLPDLLVHEVFMHHEMRPVPGVRDAATIEAVASYHTLSADVGAVATAMGAKLLALTHFVPPEFDRARLLAEIGEDFAEPILIGEDLMRIDLEAGDVVYGRLRLRLAT